MADEAGRGDGPTDRAADGREATAGDAGDPSPLVDAGALLAFTERLEAVLDRLAADDGLSEQRRRRWQRKLIDLTEAARRDLGAARAQLRRFESRIERHLEG